MYIPRLFSVEDTSSLDAFIERYPFATVVSTDAGRVVASHVPLLLERETGKPVLRGHVARENPQWHLFDGTSETLAIIHGPHGYVSPTWYASSPQVPTWNYAVVHAYGCPQIVDAEETVAIVAATVEKFESGREPRWRMDNTPLDFRASLLTHIVGFRIPIDRLEGKFKLSQNRSIADRNGVVRALQNQGFEGTALAELMVQCGLNSGSDV